MKLRRNLIVSGINSGYDGASSFPGAINVITRIFRADSDLLKELVLFLCKTHYYNSIRYEERKEENQRNQKCEKKEKKSGEVAEEIQVEGNVTK